MADATFSLWCHPILPKICPEQWRIWTLVTLAHLTHHSKTASQYSQHIMNRQTDDWTRPVAAYATIDVDNRPLSWCATYDECLVLIGEQNLVWIDEIIAAVILPECKYIHVTSLLSYRVLNSKGTKSRVWALPVNGKAHWWLHLSRKVCLPSSVLLWLQVQVDLLIEL